MQSFSSATQMRARAESLAVSNRYLARRKGHVRLAYLGGLTRNTSSFVGRYARQKKSHLVRALSNFWSGVICCVVAQLVIGTIWFYQRPQEQAAWPESLTASPAVPTAEEVFGPISSPESLTEFDPDAGFTLKLSENLTSTNPVGKPDEQPLQAIHE